MSFNLYNMLWSTRGYDWGFRFILQPEINNQDWLEHYEKMFKQSNDNDIQVSKGCLEINNNKVPYIAVRFGDPEQHKDISGRIIPHEVAILGDDIQNLQEIDLVEIKNIIWNQLSAIYQDIYQDSSQELSKKQVVASSEKTLEIISKALTDEPYQQEVLKLNFPIAILIIVTTVITIALILAIVLNQKPSVSPPPTTKESSLMIPSTARETTVFPKSSQNLTKSFDNPSNR